VRFGLPRTRGRDSIERSEPFLRAEREYLEQSEYHCPAPQATSSEDSSRGQRLSISVFRGRRRPSELSRLHRTREREHQDLALFRERSSRSRVKRAKRASLFCIATHGVRKDASRRKRPSMRPSGGSIGLCSSLQAECQSSRASTQLFTEVVGRAREPPGAKGGITALCCKLRFWRTFLPDRLRAAERRALHRARERDPQYSVLT
jgi:hypothetical protein